MNKGLYTAMMLGLALATTSAMGCAVDPGTDGEQGEGDVGAAPSAADPAAPEHTASAEAALTAVGSGGAQTQVIEIRNVTCNSGWPGTRGCSWVFTSASAIVAGTITVSINGNNGEIGHSASQIDASNINFTASVREGDAFNPGVNTTSYTVAWLRI
jgi:hypothetical protein